MTRALPDQMPFFVQKNFEDGMTDAHANRLMGILTDG